MCITIYNCHSALIVFRKDFGPGPSHLLEPSITKRGKDGTPHYSLYGRHKELTPFNTPGPSAYAPEQYNNPSSVKPPAYSMGVRTQYRKSRQMSQKKKNN